MTTEQGRPEAADRNVRMSPELMDALFTRDELGRRLRMEWGEPGEDGFYEPTITTDFSDDLVATERARVLLLVTEQHYRYHTPLRGCVLPCPFPAVLAAIDGDANDEPDRSRPCATDSRCCRWQGHDGDHMYPDGDAQYDIRVSADDINGIPMRGADHD